MFLRNALTLLLFLSVFSGELTAKASDALASSRFSHGVETTKPDPSLNLIKQLAYSINRSDTGFEDFDDGADLKLWRCGDGLLDPSSLLLQYKIQTYYEPAKKTLVQIYAQYFNLPPPASLA